MSLPFAAYIVIAIAIAAGSLGLAAFLWAIRTKQFSIDHLNKGATTIFDDEEPIGKPQDHLFHPTHAETKSNISIT
jgi:cbb3-type cytochrome oxidase maturation protein